MPIPDYQTIMLPMLRQLSDGKGKTIRELVTALAIDFNLSAQELEELLPSQTQRVFDNRVTWAKTYLKKAGLLDNSQRSVCKITTLGIDVLNRPPERITVSFLKQFPEFVEFHGGSRSSDEPLPVDAVSKTPREVLETTHSIIQKSLAQELIAKVVSMPFDFFEDLVLKLLLKMGYGGSVQESGSRLGTTGDEGIDGMIKEDKLGLETIYIQAKRWAPGVTVGRPEIQKFVGALAGQGSKKGVFLTTSNFSREAKEYNPGKDFKIVLVDGPRLAQLMIDYDLGVSTKATYRYKEVDYDYFEGV